MLVNHSVSHKQGYKHIRVAASKRCWSSDSPEPHFPPLIGRGERAGGQEPPSLLCWSPQHVDESENPQFPTVVLNPLPVSHTNPKLPLLTLPSVLRCKVSVFSTDQLVIALCCTDILINTVKCDLSSVYKNFLPPVPNIHSISSLNKTGMSLCMHCRQTCSENMEPHSRNSALTHQSNIYPFKSKLRYCCLKNSSVSQLAVLPV